MLIVRTYQWDGPNRPCSLCSAGPAKYLREPRPIRYAPAHDDDGPICLDCARAWAEAAHAGAAKEEAQRFADYLGKEPQLSFRPIPKEFDSDEDWFAYEDRHREWVEMVRRLDREDPVQGVYYRALRALIEVEETPGPVSRYLGALFKSIEGR